MFNTQRAVKFFGESVNSWQGATLALTCSAAIVFIRSAADPEPDSPKATTDALLAEVGETGLGRSSTYRYVGLARRLTSKLAEDFPLSEDGKFTGPVADILDARSPGIATQILLNYLAKAKVKRVEHLTEFVGAYTRSAPREDGGPNVDTEEGAATEPARRHASTEAVVATVADAAPSRRLDMLREIAASMDNAEEIGDAIGVFEARLEEVSNPRRKRRVQHVGRNKRDAEHSILQ